jgi:WD40 repeat protein
MRGPQVIQANYFVEAWDLADGRLLAALGRHNDYIPVMAVTDDGHLAVSGSEDRTIKIWDLEEVRLVRTLEIHQGAISDLAISSLGTSAVSCSEDHTLKLWDLSKGQEIATFHSDTEVNACAISRNGRIIAAGERSGQVHFLRAEGLA